MCLAIPGQIVEVVDDERRLAKVDVAGCAAQRQHRAARRRRRRGPGRLGADPRGLCDLAGRRGGGPGDPRPARAHGRGLRARARRAQGERDRVTAPRSRCTCDSDHCITCGDDGVPMTVLLVDARDGLALCADDDGRRERGRDRPGRAGRCRRPGARARGRRDRPIATRRRCSHEVRGRVSRRRARPGGGGRDPVAGRARPPLQGDGGVRRPHPLDLQVRRRRPAAVQRRAGARPGLPGVRDPDGPRGRRHRAGPAPTA